MSADITLTKPSSIDTAFATLEWCVTIRNVTSVAFASETEAKNYRNLVNRAASQRNPIAHLWRIDHETDQCIRQADPSYPRDTQYAGLPVEVIEEDDGLDSEGYPRNAPREWSDEELKELRRRERACDDYGSH